MDNWLQEGKCTNLPLHALRRAFYHTSGRRSCAFFNQGPPVSSPGPGHSVSLLGRCFCSPLSPPWPRSATRLRIASLGSAHGCWGGSASGDFSKAKMHRTSVHPRRSTVFCFLHSQSSIFSKQLLPCPQHHPCGWIFLLLWMRPGTLLQEGLCSVSERLSHQGDLLPEAMCP